MTPPILDKLEKLRPWQVQPAEHLYELLYLGRNCVDTSDCGTGKTYTACAVASALQLPTLVVAPKISETQWHTAAAHFGDVVSFVGYEQLRINSPYGKWANPPPAELETRWTCQCCQLRVDIDAIQPCYCHPNGFHCLIERKVKHNYGAFSFHPAVRFVIFDEIQRCGALDSLNADMLSAARRQGLRVLGLSATLASTPLQLKAIGYALGLFELRDFAKWVRPYGVRYDAAFHGLHWFVGTDKQSAIMADIRRSIIPSRGVRVAVSDIPEFPEVDIGVDLYDVDAVSEIAELQAALQALDAQSALYNPTALTDQLTAQQRVELLKIPLAVELANDYLEKGFSIGIFVNFRRTMEELRRLLKCDCFIDGSHDGVKWRQRSIDDFQANRSRLLLANSAAAGVSLSLPDVDGNHPRGGLVFPGYSAEKIKQIFGRFRRANSKSRSFYRVLLAAKTGDVKVFRALRAKLNNIDSLNDEDLQPWVNLTTSPP